MPPTSSLLPRTLLLLPLPVSLSPTSLLPVLHHVSSTSSSLLVLLLDSPTSPTQQIAHASWHALQAFLTRAYVALLQGRERRREEGGWWGDGVDVCFAGLWDMLPQGLGEEGWERAVNFEGDTTPLPPFLSPLVSSLPITYLPALPSSSSPSQTTPSPASLPSETAPSHPVVALGGTFDHLHAGHKVLLTLAAWLASRKLIVGVTDDALLASKSHAPQLEPLPSRLYAVSSFLSRRIKPSLSLDVLPISDVYGPTATESDIQALVISKETAAGAEAIHKLRTERNLPPLKTYTIDVISSADADVGGDAKRLKQAKMSSTAVRAWLSARAQEGGQGEQ